MRGESQSRWFEDVSAEGLRPRRVEAWAPVLAAVVASAVTRMIAAAGSFSWVAVGASAGVEGPTCVAVVAEMSMY